ncbi:protein zinc induced facilitator-LIKE 1 [Podospora australis]|uniref:Protein zinc induced facilitator-LIKE 1 n=1 Tax=Podospora australis TaxID=1536484 RepID=A0AAN7AKJ4_9PEZI|nr:protein zinc induced facilitator-LIKE 1 [Podospora australis]
MPTSVNSKNKGTSTASKKDAAAGPTEETPLLLQSGDGANDLAESIHVESSTPVSLPEDGNASDKDKPLPVGQIIALCYARWVEPVAFFSIFPYINQMAQENGHLADADVGFYSGLIESLFSLTQMLVMILWGRAADRFGRKPVLVFSLVGVSFATALFGTATTIAQMICYRCLAGLFAGTIVTIRTMISEHSTPKTQARAFSWFAFTGNLGILFGPLIGGALAQPATQYPSLFKGVKFFERYPYALPSLAVGLIGLSAVAVTTIFVEETLVLRTKKKTALEDVPSAAALEDGLSASALDDELSAAAKLQKLSTLELIKSPGVPIVLYAYGHIMLLAFSYTAIVPVFWFTKVSLGGFGFTPLQISMLMGLTGLSQAIWILLIFPALHRRIGTNGVLRACGAAYPFFFALCPVFNMLLREGSEVGVTTFWVVAPALLCLGCGVSMSFTAIQLALNDVSPSPVTLGTLNAVALSVVSGVRSFAPALFASLFAVSAKTQWLWGYAIWVLMVAIALAYTVVSRYLPDYEELKRQRAREEAERVGLLQ